MGEDKITESIPAATHDFFTRKLPIIFFEKKVFPLCHGVLNVLKDDVCEKRRTERIAPTAPHSHMPIVYEQS